MRGVWGHRARPETASLRGGGDPRPAEYWSTSPSAPALLRRSARARARPLARCPKRRAAASRLPASRCAPGTTGRALGDAPRCRDHDPTRRSGSPRSAPDHRRGFQEHERVNRIVEVLAGEAHEPGAETPAEPRRSATASTPGFGSPIAFTIERRRGDQRCGAAGCRHGPPWSPCRRRRTRTPGDPTRRGGGRTCRNSCGEADRVPHRGRPSGTRARIVDRAAETRPGRERERRSRRGERPRRHRGEERSRTGYCRVPPRHRPHHAIMRASDDLVGRLIEVSELHGDFVLPRAAGRASTSTSSCSSPDLLRGLAHAARGSTSRWNGPPRRARGRRYPVARRGLARDRRRRLSARSQRSTGRCRRWKATRRRVPACA